MTDPDPAQLYDIISAAIDAGVPAAAAVQAVEIIIAEADHAEANQELQENTQ